MPVERKLALGWLLLLTGLCLSAPLWRAAAGLDPLLVDLSQRYALPSAGPWLGRDELGRDVFSRLIQGATASLLIAAAATLCTLALGAAIGLLAGYAGGRIDQGLMALTDGVIALPLLPFLIVLAAVDNTRLGLPEGYAGKD